MKLINKLHNCITFDYKYIKNDSICFEFYYNKKMPKLPDTITRIKFLFAFNKNLDKLNYNLKYLHTGMQFNKYLNNLPLNLLNLTISLSFNSSSTKQYKYFINYYTLIKNNNDGLTKNLDHLPSNLIVLNIGCCYYLQLNNLPLRLKKIIIKYGNKNKINKLLSLPHLENLCFNDEYINDESVLERVYYLQGHNNFDNHTDNFTIKLNNIIYGLYFNKCVDNLPYKLEILKFGEYFNQTINNLPLNLKHLTILEYFNKSLNKLPKIYHLSYDSEAKLENIPTSIRELYIGCNIVNYNLDLLPEGIEIIKIAIPSNSKYSINDLPSSIKEIHIHKDVINSLNKIYHKKLKSIKIPEYEDENYDDRYDSYAYKFKMLYYNVVGQYTMEY